RPPDHAHRSPPACTAITDRRIRRRTVHGFDSRRRATAACCSERRSPFSMSDGALGAVARPPPPCRVRVWGLLAWLSNRLRMPELSELDEVIDRRLEVLKRERRREFPVGPRKLALADFDRVCDHCDRDA